MEEALQGRGPAHGNPLRGRRRHAPAVSDPRDSDRQWIRVSVGVSLASGGLGHSSRLHPTTDGPPERESDRTAWTTRSSTSRWTETGSRTTSSCSTRSCASGRTSTITVGRTARSMARHPTSVSSRRRKASVAEVVRPYKGFVGSPGWTRTRRLSGSLRFWRIQLVSGFHLGKIWATIYKSLILNGRNRLPAP